MSDTKRSSGINALHKQFLFFPALLSCLLLAVWAFPIVWFEKPRFEGIWFTGETAIPGWNYEPIPVSETAEKILTSDNAESGEFASDEKRRVTVFLANRAGSAENDLQLFAHPPDVCWRAAGFEMLTVTPSVTTFQVHGLEIPFERRIFEKGGRRELVYYAGLLSGRPLPFRLAWDDRTVQATAEGTNTFGLRSLKRIPQAFWSRKTLSGPKQFLRLSTEITGASAEEEDVLLKTFVGAWLKPGEFQEGSPKKEEKRAEAEVPEGARWSGLGARVARF